MHSINANTPDSLKKASPYPATDNNQWQFEVNKFMIQARQITEIDLLAKPRIQSKESAMRRMHMLEEEFTEFKDAIFCVATIAGKEAKGEKFSNHNEKAETALVELADAYADMIYVILGGMTEAGMDVSRVMAAVIESNRSKLPADGSRPPRNAMGKVIKDEGYQPPKIREALFGGHAE